MKKLIILTAALIVICATTFAQQTMDLSGKWEFAIDRNDVGAEQGWASKTLEDYINLPASMPEMLKGDVITAETKWTGSIYDSTYYINPAYEKYRREGNVKYPFFLTPSRYYRGAAWYKRDITIPNDWKGQRVELYLERPHIESTLWIDGKQVGVDNSLATAHRYDITKYVKAGSTHTIAVVVDNRLKPSYNIGQDSHSVTDQTQGNWNGIVGKIELRATPKTYMADVQVYPDLKNKKADVRVKIISDKAVKGTITLSAESFNSPKSHKTDVVTEQLNIKKNENEFTITLPMGDGMLTWDEFNPALYMLSAEMTAGEMKEKQEIRFGMREFKIGAGKYFYINGRQTLLRGTVENCLFPATGYAPMDVEAWIKVFRACRNYGLNHMRFHSYCPPAAAFEAADIVGFYIQPEGPSWPNHGVRLGNGDPVDEYLMNETIRISKEYGNSPSFCLLASGNEPYGNWVEWVTNFVEYWEKTDSRRVYTGASVGNGWQWQPRNQFHVKAGARGLNWSNTRPETISDYAPNLANVNEPYLSHEAGQWCVFPNFDEIRKYTGVNKALNFEIFRDQLYKNDMEGKGHDFFMASGKLQALCYKHEIERHLRTQGYAGFQLLCINDYSGQGSALVGVTDVFFDEKEYISPEEWRRFCNVTVPLARMEKFVFTNNEKLNAAIEVAHFGAAPIKNATVKYIVRDEHEAVIEQGIVAKKDIEIGSCREIGNVVVSLDKIAEAGQYNLEIAIEGTEFVNDWNFWVYPTEVAVEKGDVYVAETLDQQAIEVLENGGKVLLLAAGKITYGDDIKQQFKPVFWNTSWFKMRAPHTTGIWLNDYHRAFDGFPTDYHSDIQWWELVNHAQTMLLSDFPKGFEPLVSSIDTWFLSRKSGVLFEANVLNGRLMMTSLDLTSKPEERIVARQLYSSLLDYMNGNYFRPAHTVSVGTIQDLYTKKSMAIDFGTKESPDELKPTSVKPKQ